MAALSRRPFIPVLLYSLFWAGFLYMVFTLMEWSWSMVHLYSIAFFTIITLGTHLWQERSFEGDPKGFVRRFMVGLSLKFFSSALVVLIMIKLLPKEQAKAAMLVFVFLYLAYLAFSTTRLVSLSRQKNGKQSGE